VHLIHSCAVEPWTRQFFIDHSYARFGLRSIRCFYPGLTRGQTASCAGAHSHSCACKDALPDFASPQFRFLDPMWYSSDSCSGKLGFMQPYQGTLLTQGSTTLHHGPGQYQTSYYHVVGRGYQYTLVTGGFWLHQLGGTGACATRAVAATILFAAMLAIGVVRRTPQLDVPVWCTS
jgi:hypothetical protein